MSQATVALSWSVVSPVGIASPGALPPMEVGTPVDIQCSVSGGVGPYVWSATGLPEGVAMDANGHITGTPTAASTGSVVLRVVDALG